MSTHGPGARYGFPGEAPGYQRRAKALKVAPHRMAEALALRGLLEMALAVAAKHHVTIEEMCGRDRHQHITAARHALWLRFKVELGWSYPGIGAFFGVDHQTVIKGVAAAARRAHVEPPRGRHGDKSGTDQGQTGGTSGAMTEAQGHDLTTEHKLRWALFGEKAVHRVGTVGDEASSQGNDAFQDGMSFVLGRPEALKDVGDLGELVVRLAGPVDGSPAPTEPEPEVH